MTFRFKKKVNEWLNLKFLENLSHKADRDLIAEQKPRMIRWNPEIIKS